MLLHGENYDNTLRLHLQCCQVCNQHYVPPVIPGQTKLLEALGGELKTPCYGIQRTLTTPSDSIHSVARYVTSIMSPVIPGETKLLEALGGELKTPCYGMQRTMTTPSDSIHSVPRCILHINPYLPSGLLHPYISDKTISNFRGVLCTFSILFHFE